MPTLLRRLTAAAAVALAAAATGCGPRPAAAKTATAGTATPDRRADSPSPASHWSAAATRVLAAEAAPPLRPALLNAADARDRERRLADIYADLRPKLDKSRLAGGWDGPAAALADLRRAAGMLRDMAKEVLRAHAEFEAVGERYRLDLARGPAALDQAAAYYRGKAADAPEAVFRDQYARLADNCLAHAAMVRDREAGFARFQADMAEAVAFTRRTHEFLTDFDAHAALVPTADEAGLRKTYRDCLAGYVKGFAAFVALHDRYSDALRARPLPDRPGDPPPPPATPPAAPYPGGADHLVALRDGAPDPDAQAEATARFGEEYVRARAAAWADRRSLTARLDRLAGRPEPPAFRAELDEFNRRVERLNRVRVYGIGPDGVVAAGGDALPSGTHLAVVRGGARECVAVVRVGVPLGRVRYTTAVARGTLRAGDEAVRRPDSGWDQVIMAAGPRR